MQKTRERILQYLETHYQTTATELSLTFNLTQANIRHHLNILQERGVIELVGQTAADGRGRPSLVYMLSKEAQENALDELASALLLESLSGKSASQKEKFLSSAAQQLAGFTADFSNSVTIRLGQTVNRLNDLNYKAHWEAHAKSPHILIGRCPYAPIINRHPELCLMDKELINNLTGLEFTQVEKMSRRQSGPATCRFCLKQ
ncbi:MAG: ArsR family transcriptional regulator [Anaerolineales bacterium]|nr:ArsR family transcriptional regulator [Anaerolineales bacterium]